MAEIFYVEDDELTRQSEISFLTHEGHNVSLIATTLEGALAIIAGNSIRQLGINFALVDGNLSVGDQSGMDGEFVAKEIKAKYPEVVVIGRALRNDIPSATKNCPRERGNQELANILKGK